MNYLGNPTVVGYSKDDLENLAKKVKVGVIPEDAFGSGGEGFIHISYAALEGSIHTAMQRIKDYLGSVKRD